MRCVRDIMVCVCARAVARCVRMVCVRCAYSVCVLFVRGVYVIVCVCVCAVCRVCGVCGVCDVCSVCGVCDVCMREMCLQNYLKLPVHQ